MVERIKSITPLDNYALLVEFDDGVTVQYDMNEDINTLPGYDDLKNIPGLWEQVQLDESCTCVFWNDYIDLASDTIYQYGKVINLWKIAAYRELKIIESKLKAGYDPRLAYREYKNKLNEPSVDPEEINIILTCLEGYMNDKGIEIPQIVDIVTLQREEGKIIQEFIQSRAKEHGIALQRYCELFGLEYKEQLHIE